MKETVSRLWY